ncbi:hypothetical protein [Halopseudomonas pelagia]|uniref:hypothetical protein n=1 Tax=Halopseudomonas pelagia TaxID=553151 RepID=UPI0030DBC8A1
MSLVGGGEHPMFLMCRYGAGLAESDMAWLGARRLSQIGEVSCVSQSAKWVGWIERKVNQIKGICAQEVAQMGFWMGLGGGCGKGQNEINGV